MRVWIIYIDMSDANIKFMNGLIFRWHFFCWHIRWICRHWSRAPVPTKSKNIEFGLYAYHVSCVHVQGFCFIFKSNVDDVLHVIDKHNIILDVLVAQNSEEIIFI